MASGAYRSSMDRRVATARVLVIVASTAALAACASPAPTPSSPTITTAAPVASGVAPATPFAVVPSTAPAPTPVASLEPAGTPVPVGGPIGTTGSVVVIAGDGSLVLVDAAGRSSVLASTAEGGFAFPAWSPDGSRIAAIRSDGSESAILVFDVTAAGGDRSPPTVILRSTTLGPFYLSWRPDGDAVSYLASDARGLALKIAAADGSSAMDGTGPGTTIQTGSPFYYDWIGDDGLLAHIGAGPEAFVGEIGLDGTPTGSGLGQPGDFRSAVVSRDRDLVSYVRVTASGRSEIVLGARDGSSEHAVPVFGSAALAFDPTDGRVAAIGASEAGQTDLQIPIGPLRLIEPKGGHDRTLLDGSVVGFWWSPDGMTIAVLRIQPVNVEASAGANEARLLFVDVASGDIRSQTVVVPGRLFIDQLLVYFDQYALSHDLWSPDSRTFLMPVTGEDGRTRVAVVPLEGGDPVFIDGQVGFWSPTGD
jgi:hypothetical protein